MKNREREEIPKQKHSLLQEGTISDQQSAVSKVQEHRSPLQKQKLIPEEIDSTCLDDAVDL